MRVILRSYGNFSLSKNSAIKCKKFENIIEFHGGSKSQAATNQILKYNNRREAEK